MKKIRLDLEALDVESFATAGLRDATRGTVRGAGTGLSNCQCYPASYFNEATCIEICPLQPATLREPGCIVVPDDTWDDPSCFTCATCAGMLGC